MSAPEDARAGLSANGFGWAGSSGTGTTLATLGCSTCASSAFGGAVDGTGCNPSTHCPLIPVSNAVARADALAKRSAGCLASALSKCLLTFCSVYFRFSNREAFPFYYNLEHMLLTNVLYASYTFFT